MTAKGNVLSPLYQLLFISVVARRCRGTCMPLNMLVTVEEEMQKVQDGTSGGALVARLTFAYDDDGSTRSTVSTAPCSFEVYDDGYVFVDDAALYTVEEVFAGGAYDGRTVSAGDKVPIIWGTDTGYRRLIPDYIGDDADGFLAMMYPLSSCYGDGAYEYGEAYPGPIRPYTTSECQMRMNRKWSEVSEKEREALRSAGAAATSAAPAAVVVPSEPEAVVPEPDDGGGDPPEGAGPPGSAKGTGSPSSGPTKSPVVPSRSPTAAPTPFDPLAENSGAAMSGRCIAILYAPMVIVATTFLLIG